VAPMAPASWKMLQIKTIRMFSSPCNDAVIGSSGMITNGIDHAPPSSRATKPSHNFLVSYGAIGDDVLRASRGPTVRLRVPAKSAPLTGGVRLSFQAHNVPLADKDGHI
jgi:hypothetical protein